MALKSIKDLPTPVQNHLPKHAQEIYLEAFNNAWEQYKDPKKRQAQKTQMETAHAVAWNAVKLKYVKNEDTGNREKRKG